MSPAGSSWPDPISAESINDFMDRFHDVERELKLFASEANGELWWDSVRFEVCQFLYSRLTGVSHPSAQVAPKRGHPLGQLRRWGKRKALFANALVQHRSLLVLRAARNRAGRELQDDVLDPIIEALDMARVIETMPYRYHLPDVDPWRTPSKLPPLARTIAALIQYFGMEPSNEPPLDALIRRVRAEFEAQVEGYDALFARMKPKAVLIVQNGMAKALFHSAKSAGIRTIEAQHGLIAHGHPAYSYARDVDYSGQSGFPSLFLTLSAYWQGRGFYPALRREVVGNDHFGAGIGPLRNPIGAIMIISANIYHTRLLALTREISRQLPNRRFIYKLHPNQGADERLIRAAVADRPNVEIGAALTPAPRYMSDVSHVVAVQSTVVYEALQHRRRVCILPWHNYQIHEDVFDLPGVSVPASAQQLGYLLEESGPITGRQFFDPFDASRARRLICGLT